ncbi:UDP-N-acetylglucosamine 1-carboxyvinyltransferase [Candidatus Kinetoplastibacterium blastocrithidii TCC012E]|uniref:UDP-N-acetylglucosamine 1-carboxyvinyltransferase n=2 Tax=Candidatus Kinetoplastidibacterium blastocrithidiae TaxID=233181 RepID=M1LAE5_9PROT|nr:UDP-N-acetylglucosamine 1-carboxyvinyltransferase [Candidatus Kinetoplastibacterium blastocrithidii (ex Strigomonas culicis)]AGF49478.1 UDP-N-acetylglucosamine 1-carboxyvinyltransferase [Candidatus Kinetoplastibacterium blastocrithidii TCC012E]
MASMEELQIIGGSQLEGDVNISGAKNAALPILCAGLLTSETISLSNLPDLNDVSTTIKLLSKLGSITEKNGPNKVSIMSNKIDNLKAPYELVKTMRASILVLGPLLTRFGEAIVSMPGGCAIGQRPIDQHIKCLSALGADIRVEHGFVIAKAKKLKGTIVRPDIVTVTGTENIIMAATLAEGETIIENAACEPEIVDLSNMLIKMGANIKGHGTSRIVINGVDKLYGANHRILPDRIEAGTFLCALAATGGNIRINGVNPYDMLATIDKIRLSGVSVKQDNGSLLCSMNKKPKSVNIVTCEYPGLATDMQAQFMALNCVSYGTSMIVENIFENRYLHVQELNRLGADITINGNSATVRGVDFLSGATVRATDLRASASLVIAGLVAQGKTTIEQIYHLDRGYENIEVKLQKLGANIKRATNRNDE